MKTSALTLALIAAAVTSLPAAAQTSKDFEELRNEVQRLRQELNALKGDKAVAPTASTPVAERLEQIELKQKDAVVVGDIPGSFRIPGSETSIKLYGYAEVNAVHEFAGDNTANDYSTFLPYAPINGSTARKGVSYITARTSRFGIEASTPSSSGPIGIKVEGDFSNDPRLGNSAVGGSLQTIYTQQATNSYNFRLRQAYGTFGGFTIGQTWSTFMDGDNAPETVDFNGPIGSTFIRQPVIRYAYPTQTMGTYTVALENPVSYALDPATRFAHTSGFSKVPDLIGRWDKGYDWGAVSLRGVTHEIRVVDDATALDVSKRGYGIGATTSVKTRGGQDLLSMAVTYGDGIGRYFNYIEGAAVDTANQRILMERALGVVLGYQYKASDTFRSNVVLGWQQSQHNAYTDFVIANRLGSGQYGINKSAYQAHFGFIYTPVKNVDLGAEYIFGQRKTLADEKGDLSRINLMARYTFN